MAIKTHDLKCWTLLDIGEKGSDYILSEKKNKLETDLTEMLSTQKVVHGIYMYGEKSHILTCKKKIKHCTFIVYFSP